MASFEIIRVTDAVLTFALVLLAERDRSRRLYAVSVVLGFLFLGATAANHVVDPVSIDVLVRLAHLTAFAIWLGGATWHNIVIVSGIRRFPETKSVLKSQAERFRPLVILFILALLVTGIYQTAAFIGLALSVLSLFSFFR